MIAESDIQQLIIEFKKGDKAAFSKIYKILYHPIFLFSKNIVNEAEAADVTADAFYKLYLRCDDFGTLPEIRGFLYVTARNACFDYLKREKMKDHKEGEIVFLTEQEQKMILHSEIESEVIAWIKIQIGKLPTKEAKVLSLAYFDGYKNEEIAKEMNLSHKTVRNLKALGVKKIRTALLNKKFNSGKIIIPTYSLAVYLDIVVLH